MQRLIDFLSHHTAASLAGTTTTVGGLAGLVGAVPEGIHPYVWLVVTLLGPVITAALVDARRRLSARRRARLLAAAAELRRCAEEHEAASQRLLADADAANDAEGKRLHERARLARVEAAADEGEAAAIDAEMTRGSR
jgi:hypothetical protein